jgi:CheY-like chemotaxis protein
VNPGQYVMLAVTDTGCGMTHEVMEHVFEPFFTTKPEGQGTGLGLSMVYGFVKQSNGHINIYSEPGHGTTVRIYLPRVLQAEDVTVDIDSGAIVGGSELVLVVEDDADVRETVVELLTDLGYAVLKAKDAKDALAIIDLLFTDVVMPGPVRSPELARQARERLPNAAILFTSGYTDNAIVHGGRLDPGIELLSKPYRREALARKVRHVLRNQQQRRQSIPTDLAPADATRRLRVLFVEDDDLVRAATSEMLGEMGYTVLQATDGATALRMLDAGRVDLVMCDDSLPDMRGADVAQKVRERLPNVPVIFATGASHMPMTSSGAKIDHATLLRKPFNLAALNDALTAATKTG